MAAGLAERKWASRSWRRWRTDFRRAFAYTSIRQLLEGEGNGQERKDLKERGIEGVEGAQQPQ